MERKWWKEAFGYQIYIRSFFDSNNDGIGDLRGIIEKLDYIHKLGVNLIWICPFYDSPMDDNGYDVSDFYKVAKEYGNIDDAIELINKAHNLGIKVIIDLILNHTSDEHQWFIESRKSTTNPYRDYYIWKKPRYIDNKRVEPTNWASFFGGSCWKYDSLTDEYYMKIFSDKMPDLNWENPEVVKEISKIGSWWCDLGVDGFRIDAVSHLAKADFIDSNKYPEHKYKPDWEKYSNLPKIHKYLKTLNQECFSKYDLLTVGEVGGGALVKDAINYIKPENQELNMVFNFDHNWFNNAWNANNRSELKFDILKMKEIFNKWQKGLYGYGWNALYWLNHDHPRLGSHYGDIKYYQESVKMLATAMYFMWGTPFIYNGEEIGMLNPEFESIDDFRDVSIKNQYKINVINNHQDPKTFIEKVTLTSRDNARSIMQWDDSEYGGFSKVKPWNIIGDYQSINVKKEISDPYSIFNYYRKVINLRLNSPYKDTIVYGTYDQVYNDHKEVYGYIRKFDGQEILILCNFSDIEIKLDALNYEIKNIILSNYYLNEFTYKLLPYQALVLEIEKKETF